MTLARHGDAIAGSERARLSEIIAESLSRDTLKAVCVACGLDDTGKEKAPLVETILTAGSKSTNGYKIDTSTIKGSTAREGVAPIGALLPALGGEVVDEKQTRFRCVIYDDRPRTCREFTLGSEHCLTARRRVGLSL